MRLARSLGRQTLWIGFFAVLVPLVVLLGLQYRWMVRLEHTSAMVHKATLSNFLEGVTWEVESFYGNTAERVLNLSSATFTQGHLKKAADHFKLKDPEGVRRLFVISFVEDPDGYPLYFDSSCSTFSQPSKWSPEVKAVWMATSPWRAFYGKGERLERAMLAIDEHDPEYRIILNPITDDSSRVVGLAGMILDPAYFEDVLLPRVIHKAQKKFFPDDPRQAPLVEVRDAWDRQVFASDPKGVRKASFEIHRSFRRVFTDWQIGLSSRHATVAQVARRNFLLNLGLSAVLAMVLLGGLVLSFQTASRQMKLSQMKNDFVSNVSHELRTPLASIRVFGEFLRLGRVESPDKMREYGEYIETESRRLTQLINNILDFASIESGRKSYRFERADLEEVISETLKTFGVRLRQNGFCITFEGPGAPLPRLYFDPAAIAQSLSNLLDNAVKYSNGSKEIAVGLRREGSWAVIWVRDQGIGIPKDDQAKIFERFHRVSTGLIHDVKGSGLGLSIVQHIVQAHRGRVAVESRIGDGSTFSMYLPIDPLEAPAPGVLAPSEA
jgi:signal transduction histidine kinase